MCRSVTFNHFTHKLMSWTCGMFCTKQSPLSTVQCSEGPLVSALGPGGDPRSPVHFSSSTSASPSPSNGHFLPSKSFWVFWGVCLRQRRFWEWNEVHLSSSLRQADASHLSLCPWSTNSTTVLGEFVSALLLRLAGCLFTDGQNIEDSCRAGRQQVYFPASASLYFPLLLCHPQAHCGVWRFTPSASSCC